MTPREQNERAARDQALAAYLVLALYGALLVVLIVAATAVMT